MTAVKRAIVSADFALRDARQIEIPQHVTSPLHLEGRTGRSSFSVRPFTAETRVRFRWTRQSKHQVMRVVLPIGVIAGTLNVMAYRGQWAFAPEL